MLQSQLGDEIKDKRHFFMDEMRREYRDEVITKIRFKKFQENQFESELSKNNENDPIIEQDEFKNCSQIEKIKIQRKSFIDSFNNKDVDAMNKVLLWFNSKIRESQADEDVAQEFLRTGLIPYLLDILGYSDEGLATLSKTIICIFGNIVSGKNDTVKLLRENKVFEIFILLLQKSKNNLDNIVFCLSNIAGSHSDSAVYLINHDILDVLYEKVAFIENPSFDLAKNVYWLVSNLSVAIKENNYKNLTLKFNKFTEQCCSLL